MTTNSLTNTSYQVSCEWLKQHQSDAQVCVLDATMEKPISQSSSALTGLVPGAIPGAIRFDFSHHIVDANSAISNTMPCADIFQQKVRELGINQDSLIVVYDKQGLFAAARAWFMFKTMGFDNVAILKGGLPAWLAAGYDLETAYCTAEQPGDFVVVKDKQLFVDKHYVLNAIQDEHKQIVDARSYGRFSGQEKDPRADMRNGHIPHSLNLHYANLIENGCLIDKARLKAIFDELVPSPNEFIFSCGSGVTACILALAAEIAGFDNIKVYDGSWSEWGSDKLLPIDTVLD
jgi:thiosulfate/3-mercaptopyruvate sulfurtransferase